MKVIKSQKLSKPHEPRYICIDENTNKVLDDAQGYGFKTERKAYACYYYTHKTDKQKEEEKRKNNIIESFLNTDPKLKHRILDEVFTISFYGMKDQLTNKEVNEEIYNYLDTINFNFKEHNISKKYFLKYLDNN